MATWREETAFPTEEQQARALEDGQALLLVLRGCRIDMGTPEGVRATLLGEQGEAEASRAEGNSTDGFWQKKTGESEESLSRKGETGVPGQARPSTRVLEAGKVLISVGSRVAPGAELERPRAAWAQEERGKFKEHDAHLKLSRSLLFSPETAARAC